MEETEAPETEAIPALTVDAINRTRMARRAGVDLAHASRILTGKMLPGIGPAVKMANYLSISLDEFYVLISTGAVQPQHPYNYEATERPTS